MRIIRRLSTILIGFTLFIAGLLKLMDPVGAGLVMDEYFRFFHLNFLHFASGFAGSAMALCETVLGIALITGVWRRVVAIVTLAALSLFTLITVVLVIFNPVMDCGCFGEAVHLTHFQSLLKNLILLALWCVSFLPFRSMEPTRKVKYVSFSIATVSVSLFLLYSVFSIPMLDFTDYKPGTELTSIENMDWMQGDEAVLLSFSNAQGEYTDSLALHGNVLAASVYDPAEMSAQRWHKLSALMGEAAGKGYTPLVLTASTPELITGQLSSPELLPYIYFADRKTLLTLNRSNGGVSFISDGQIVAKWSVNRLPDGAKLDQLAATDPIESLVAENHGRKIKFQAFLLYVCAVILLL